MKLSWTCHTRDVADQPDVSEYLTKMLIKLQIDKIPLI